MCGVVLWGIDFTPHGKRSLLRIFIDVPAGATATEDGTPPSVSVEQCVAVTQQVNALLDVHDPIAGEYTLEVSSPGWDRSFYAPEQLRAYVGCKVALRLINAMANRRKMTGKLLTLTDHALAIAIDNETFNVDYSNIDKANLIYEP